MRQVVVGAETVAAFDTPAREPCVDATERSMERIAILSCLG